MSLNTSKTISKVMYNNVEIPLSDKNETTFTFSIPDQCAIYSNVGSNRTAYEIYEKGTHTITVPLNSSIIMVNTEGNILYGIGTNCTLTGIYSFGGIPTDNSVLVDITGENAVLDLT